MKKSLTAFALGACLLALCANAGCGAEQSGSLDVVCTIFPQYDWVRELTAGEDGIDLTIIQDSGVDLHSYQASASDILKIKNCDVLVYVGGESDQWVEDALRDANPAPNVVKLLDKISALEEEDVPGAEEDHEHGDERELDEHVWLSLKNAEALCRAIAEALKAAAPAAAEGIDGNLSAYLTKLEALEREYAETVSSAVRKTVLFADRFPFRYLAEDYGLTYYAAFSGCSGETEASLSTIKNLIDAVDSNALPYVLVLEGSDRKIANQIIANSRTKDQTILEMNSIQSVTKQQMDAGVNYYTLMRDNLEALATALN